MFEDILVIIPCRAGSQRFPHKNTALFQGVPLVVNTINTAKEAGLNNILVSTDDKEVMKLCVDRKICWTDRPAELCDSDAKREDVAKHAVERAEVLDIEFMTICLMQVTSPLLQAATLKVAVNLYLSHKLPSLVAVDNRYQPVGAFYIVNDPGFDRTKSEYQTGGGLYVLPPEQCLDVDYKYQLSICEMVASGNIWGSSHVN